MARKVTCDMCDSVITNSNSCTESEKTVTFEHGDCEVNFTLTEHIDYSCEDGANDYDEDEADIPKYDICGVCARAALKAERVVIGGSTFSRVRTSGEKE